MDSKNPLELLDGRSSEASSRFAEILAGIEDVPRIPGILWTWLQEGSTAGWWPYAFIPLAIVFVAGARWAMAATHRILERRRGPMPVGAIRRPVFAWIIGLIAGFALFALSSKLAGPPRQVASAVLVAFLLSHLINIGIDAVLGRYRATLDGTRQAALASALRLAHVTSAYALGIFALILILHRAGVPLEARIFLGGLLLVGEGALGLLLVQRIKRTGCVLPPPPTPEAQKRRTLLLRLVARTWTKFFSILIVLIVVTAIWRALTDVDGALVNGWVSLLIFGLTPLLMALASDLLPEETPDGKALSPWHHTLVHGLHLALIAVAWLALARLWGLDLQHLANEGLGERLADGLVSIAIILVLAHLIWEVTRTLLDVYAEAKPGAHGGDMEDAAHGTHSASRLQTFAPLLRKFLFVVLIVMSFFLMLSSIGVDIGPLLAGAGVVGIAIGFGAQTLVRDIVSGIFYLLDDSFRIGEYVEIGEVRGTVEGMSIRSLKLRHQRGAIHTLPFGEIKHLTNYSRDWQVLRLDFQFAYGTDTEKIRKLVKDMGKKFLADPTYGPMFIAPLKSQGVRGTSPIGLTVGIKFTAKPGTQYLLRREVYRQLCESFIANDIEFAQPRVLVQSVHGEHLSHEDLRNAASAAQDLMPEGKKA